MADWREIESDVQEQIEALERLRGRLASASGHPEADGLPMVGGTDPDLEGAFLELLSHEVRTPLTSTIGYLDLMLAGDAGELTGEQQHCVAVARRGASRVLALIADLVVVARSEAGWLAFAPQPVDLVPSAREAAAIADASTTDVAVEAVLPDTLEVLADPSALLHLFTSLLGRAVRHARPGGQVDVRIWREGAGAVVAIAHSGRPLPPTEGATLRGIMDRESRAVADAVHGAGLEMASAKAVVAAFGGRMWGEGDPYDGTRLLLELPLAERSAGEVVVNGSGPGHD